MVFRGEGGLQEYSGRRGFIIQVWPIPSSKLGINENGDGNRGSMKVPGNRAMHYRV